MSIYNLGKHFGCFINIFKRVEVWLQLRWQQRLVDPGMAHMQFTVIDKKHRLDLYLSLKCTSEKKF